MASLKTVRSAGSRISKTLALAAAGLAVVGCEGPANFSSNVWINAGQTLSVRVCGEKPVVDLKNHGPGAVGRVALVSDNRTLSFHGLGPGAEASYTLANNDRLELTQVSGCQVAVEVRHSTGVELIGPTTPSSPAASPK